MSLTNILKFSHSLASVAVLASTDCGCGWVVTNPNNFEKALGYFIFFLGPLHNLKNTYGLSFRG